MKYPQPMKVAPLSFRETSRLVMIPILRHLQHLLLVASRHAIHQPVLGIDPPRSPA